VLRYATKCRNVRHNGVFHGLGTGGALSFCNDRPIGQKGETMSKALVRKSIKRFREAFIGGIEGIVNASEIYVESIDEDPKNADIFKEKCGDWIPASAWSGFEAVGRKWMHPKLLMGGMADRKKNTLVKRLPYSVQERVFSGDRFECLTQGGKTLKVDLLEATYEQAEQICDGGTIRSIAAQKAYIESKPAETINAEVLPYTITDKGEFMPRRNSKYTKAELMRIIKGM